MTGYLLAAEADQIQDLLFRSSRLREVVGGSQLLSRFCTETVPGVAARHKGSAIVTDGGTFRLVFGDRDQARACGATLAEEYRLMTDGRLSVAEPVRMMGSFTDDHAEAQRQLRLAKQRGDPPDAVMHLPYIAFCQSCGRGLGESVDRDRRVVCAICRDRAVERRSQRRGFLSAFTEAVSAVYEESDVTLPEEADEVARLDPRRYVAYLCADGNGMGVLFSACDREQIHELSNGLSQNLRESLAAPCRLLLDRLAEASGESSAGGRLPVLPLILGGDDCFALLPARWGIDIARRFCVAFQQRMRELIVRVQLDHVRPPASIAAAVVVCKGHYPYRLAHEHGRRALARAKRLSYLTGESSVAFDLVRDSAGSESAASSVGYRATLEAYPVGGTGDDGGVAALLAQRVALADLPGGRRAELESLFEDAESAGADKVWNQRLERLLSRIGRAPRQRDRVVNALKVLGDPRQQAPAFWRAAGPGFGHGLPDLLRMWEFLFDLERPHTEYRGGDRS